MTKTEEFVSLSISAFKAEIIKRITFSRPKASDIQRVSGRLVAHRGKKLLSFEYSLPGDTVSHKNVGEGELFSFLSELISEYRQANLITTLTDVEWKISASGKEALLGADKLRRKLDFSGDAPDFERAIEALDRQKNYIIPPSADFLIGLGVSDKNGRVHDKRQAKYRQINRFIEHIEDIYPSLPDKDELVIYDLCCGKSYLSFAVYYYLTEIKKRRVNMLAVDLKADVIEWCSRLAASLGYSGMHFLVNDVRNTPKDKTPDMVISLHACDIATDIVINSAAELGARVILSTPCCHRYLNDKLSLSELSFVSKHSHLKNKLCEVLTDAIRAERLVSFGYDVSVLELTDPSDTPKNTLIRAILNKPTEDELKRRQNDYDRLLELVVGERKNDYLKDI